MRRALGDAQCVLWSDYAQPVLHDRLMAVLNQRPGGTALPTRWNRPRSRLPWMRWIPRWCWTGSSRGLGALITWKDLARHLAAPLQQVVACATECVQLAGLGCPRICQAIYLTGGSSALRPLRDALRMAPDDPAGGGAICLGKVAAGLAVAAPDHRTVCRPIRGL